MVSGQVILIAASFAGLWYLGHETVKGVKKFDHVVAGKFHHKKKPAATVKDSEPVKPISTGTAAAYFQK